MLWNPVRNESLFLVSCAERLIEHPTVHSEEEILKRIEYMLDRDVSPGTGNYATSLMPVCLGSIGFSGYGSPPLHR